MQMETGERDREEKALEEVRGEMGRKGKRGEYAWG